MNSLTDIHSSFPESKIRVGAVSYLNTQPLIYGLQNLPIQHQIQLAAHYPGKLAEMLVNDEIDLGLIPVAAIRYLPKHFIQTNYCIGAVGHVASVGIFSQVPMQDITTVVLDYQSRTSVALAKILLAQYWKQAVTFISATPAYETTLQHTTAGVIIGDRALINKLIYPYYYDLAEAWLAFTNLPFVFATWVSNKPLPASFINNFNLANQYGLDRIAEVANANQVDYYDSLTYFTQNISYQLDDAKRAGLQQFLNFLPKHTIA